MCVCAYLLNGVSTQEHGLPQQKEGHWESHSKKDNGQCSCHENETRENQKHKIHSVVKTNTRLPFHIHEIQCHFNLTAGQVRSAAFIYFFSHWIDHFNELIKTAQE